jgi:hypothetical protein
LEVTIRFRKREVSGRERESFLFSFSFFFNKAREARKTGLVLFNEAMEKFEQRLWKESLPLFQRAAAKGHEESVWILSVLKNGDMEWIAWREAFAKTEEPLGWHFAGWLSFDRREQFDFCKKSAEGGCSWGQAVYGRYFGYRSGYVEKDMRAYVEWLEKAADQNNPEAMHSLGEWFRNGGDDMMKAVAYYRTAAELGWKNSMYWLSSRLLEWGHTKDLRQAAMWGAKGNKPEVFWYTLTKAARHVYEGATSENLNCDFNQLCYSLGSGLY